MGKRNVEQDVWKHVARGAPDECWPWTRSCTADGYGHFQYDMKPQLAHRVVYALLHGPIPDGLVVMHSCDNPPCCNPEHLSLGTVADNNRDRDQKGRTNRNRDLPTGDDHWTHQRPEAVTRGEDHSKAKLTEAQVIELRTLVASGSSANDLAVQFGVYPETILAIASGEKWAHVGGPIRVRPVRDKATPETVVAMRNAVEAGETTASVARRFELSHGTVRAIVERRTWKHVV